MARKNFARKPTLVGSLRAMRGKLFFPGVTPLFLLLSLVLLLAIPACSPKVEEDSDGFKDLLREERVEKDRSFRSAPDSPLPETDKPGFQGLDYYPPDADLRFHLKLNRYDAPQHLRLGTNTGEIRTGLRYGYFEFQIQGRKCRLQAYRLDDAPLEGGPYLFVPFLDTTSGGETYAGGRYIDLRENTSGFYELDFNRAYNPSCAYGKSYSCPVPPEENRLPVPVRAGEKKYRH